MIVLWLKLDLRISQDWINRSQVNLSLQAVPKLSSTIELCRLGLYGQFRFSLLNAFLRPIVRDRRCYSVAHLLVVLWLLNTLMCHDHFMLLATQLSLWLRIVPSVVVDHCCLGSWHVYSHLHVIGVFFLESSTVSG